VYDRAGNDVCDRAGNDIFQMQAGMIRSGRIGDNNGDFGDRELE
jgi:hypothetical protein